MAELVVLGVIVRAQGLRGQVRVKPFGLHPELTARLAGARLFVRSSTRTLRTILRAQRWNRGMWIVELEDCRTREAAEKMVGWEICLAEEDRPELGPNEFYEDELIGLSVVDCRTDELLGKVVAVRPNTAADLLEVRRPDGRWFYLPTVRTMIAEVDLVGRSIRVELPDGLIEINDG